MSFRNLSLIAAATWLAGTAQAAPTVYFGENQGACTTPGIRATCTVGGNPLTARTSFLSQLIGVGTENFEGFANGAGQAAPLPILFAGSVGNITATVNSPGNSSVSNGTSTPSFSDTEEFGRWNTAPGGGTHWYTAFDSFSIDFDVAISAFGFYGTDVGDFAGQMTITLTAEGGALTVLNVGNTINGSNGSLLFWGFTDLATKYTRITFGNTAAGFDGFGFDGMTIGDRAQVVPAPGSLALVGLGLTVLGAARRRRG
jgi:PEP-CTERM motif